MNLRWPNLKTDSAERFGFDLRSYPAQNFLCYRSFICWLSCETDSELEISIQKVIRRDSGSNTGSREGKREVLERRRSPALMMFQWQISASSTSQLHSLKLEWPFRIVLFGVQIGGALKSPYQSVIEFGPPQEGGLVLTQMFAFSWGSPGEERAGNWKLSAEDVLISYNTEVGSLDGGSQCLPQGLIPV